jgi:tripartite-type tricarboxylate transporter receptor subunit TctC
MAGCGWRRGSGRAVAATALGLLLLLPALGRADDYPARPIRWVVPFPAGGSTDVTARLLTQPVAEALGQPVVIDNRGGAAGSIGTELVAHAPADGYTMLFTTVTLSVNESLYKRLPYDLHRDLRPVVLVAQVPNIMVVPASLPVTTVQEFIAYARARPGQINFGSGGTGTSVHINGELFKLLTHLEMQHVPYKGDGPAMQDLIAGQVQVVFAQLPGAVGHIAGGQLRPLAVTSPKRAPSLPDVPTLVESGIDDDAVGWYGIFAPAATPPEIVAQVNRAINATIALDAVRGHLGELGTVPLGGTPDEFARMLDADIAKWAKVVRDANIKVE